MTNTAIQKPADVPIKDTTKISVDWLKLDHENPRLVGTSSRTTEESIVAQLYRGEELGELIQSIAANGRSSASNISTVLLNGNLMQRLNLRPNGINPEM